MGGAERILIERHRAEFMARAFPPPKPIGKGVPHQVAVATIKMCHEKAAFDKIIYIMENWQPDLKIKDVEPGYERDCLKKFHADNPSSTKLYAVQH